MNQMHTATGLTPLRCPITRATDVVPLCEVGEYGIWRCPSSSTDFVWPAPSDEELKRYYDRSSWFEGGEPGGYESYDRQTESSLPMVAAVLDSFPADGVRYVLDIGCGYGTHLRMAADRGWKCFGVEPSDHARKTAIERHGDVMYVVERVGELIPHEFDLILMLDVLEHVADPYELLFGMFNQGAIGPKTRLVVATPNARSADAVRDPAHWAYRHPPSHLVYYSARSLKRLFETLQFEHVEVRGASPLATADLPSFGDETLSTDEAFTDHAGLICEARGSHFYAFMTERYVPGTWSKLAEYEHVPRYQFARHFAQGARVLDFGCGTGYGSRDLADSADDVLGLDIDASALDWARFWHESRRLRFERHDDLGATLPPASFDLVTCFEMIEHVDHATQQATVASLARLVTPDGKLLISTPNPAVTANYGENPFHIREMTEAQFIELLAPHFAHVAIYRQWIRPSVLIGTEPIPSGPSFTSERLHDDRIVDEPPAFIAVCSHRPIAEIAPFCSFDASFDMVLAETRLQRSMTGMRFDNYLLRESRSEANHRVEQAQREIASHLESNRTHAAALVQQEETIASMHAAFDEQARNIEDLRREIEEQAAALKAAQGHSGDRESELLAHVEALALQQQTIDSMRASFDEQARNIEALHDEHHGQAAALQTARERAFSREETLRVQVDALAQREQTIAEMRAAFDEQARSIEALRAEREQTLSRHVDALGQQERTIAEMRVAFDEQARNIEDLRKQLTAHAEALAAAHQQAADRESALTVAREHAEQQAVAQAEALRVALEHFQRQSSEYAETLRSEAEANQKARDDYEETLSALRSVIERQSVAQVEVDRELAAKRERLERMDALLAERDRQLASHAARTLAAEALVSLRTAESEAWVGRYRALEMTRFVRLARILHGNSGSRAPLLEAIYLVVGGLIPRSMKARLAPVAARLRNRFAKRPVQDVEDVGFAPYRVKAPKNIRATRPRVLHVIANFMTGGSSRLVVDLIERLGGEYEQKILTSFIPSPVNYVGADITEVRDVGDTATMRAFVKSFNPHIVHVHYWGDCDEPWYRAAFSVVGEHGCPIVQNINTPVAPFTDAKLARNVFVSRYVLDHFGEGHANCTVVYPGSDFTLFAPVRRPRRAQGCIGMVYRLERDKLDEFAIEPFIEAARSMPGLKCLIVGDGSLFDHFVGRVHAEGLDDAFEFTGFVSYSTLPAYYKRMDVFVAPIWKESFGQVSAFAMNMGIPVIGYDVGAIPEIIADPSLVAPPRDAAALAAIAVKLVRDDDARASIGITNRKRAGRMFSVDAMIRSYRELYRDVVRQ